MSVLAAGWSWAKFLEPGTLVFVMGGLTAVCAIAFPQWSKVRRNETAARLKHKMIDRGFSADEIERVLNAGDDGEDSSHSG